MRGTIKKQTLKLITGLFQVRQWISVFYTANYIMGMKDIEDWNHYGNEMEKMKKKNLAF